MRAYGLDKREEARQLRRSGMPFKRIAARIGVSVATAHAWTRDIELTPEQIAHNLTGPTGPQSPEHIAKRVEAWRQKNRERRLEAQREGRLQARRGDLLHMAGCMLYWAEGSKSRNDVKFANSDPDMIRFFSRFLKESLGVSARDFRIRLNVYTNNGLALVEIEDHWLDVIGAPRSTLRGHTLNHYPTSSSGQKRRRLPYGVCTLKVGSTQLVQHIFGAIQEYGGFDQPRWLDGPPRKRPRKPSDETLAA